MPWAPIAWAELERELSGIPLAARGALVALAGRLWATPTCSVPDDDATLAAWCGARLEWAAVAAGVRAVLEPHPEVPDALTWGWLRRLWLAQWSRLAVKRAAGQRGGKASQRAKAERAAGQALRSNRHEQHSEHPSGAPLTTDAQEQSPRAPLTTDAPQELKETDSLPLTERRESQSLVRDASASAWASAREAAIAPPGGIATATAPDPLPPSAAEGRAAARPGLVFPNAPMTPVRDILALAVRAAALDPPVPRSAPMPAPAPTPALPAHPLDPTHALRA